MIDHHPIGSSDISISFSIRFWLFFIPLLPSIACSLFALYHLLSDRVLRHAANNQTIIVLLSINLIYELTDIPFFLGYYRLGTVWPATPGFCLLWMVIDEGLFCCSLMLIAWFSIERHIIIFHDQWVSTRKKRIFVLYLPIAVLLLYCVMFHVVTILLPPCQNTFDYTLDVCGHPLCYYEGLIATWDVAINYILPTLVIVVFSIGLLLRALFQKRRMRQGVRWRKHRKMTIQLLCISISYVLFYIPDMLVELAQMCCMPGDFGASFQLYAEFFAYYLIFLFPFLTAASLSEFPVKIKNIFACFRRQAKSIERALLRSVHRFGIRPVVVEPTM